MFIRTHQHPILDVLEEHGIPVFIINLCNVRKVVDKKKVNQPYKEEQEEAYSQIVGKRGAVVEIAFVHVPVFFTIWPKPWIIDRQRKDFEPDQVNCGTPVWVLACILGLFGHRLPSSELALKKGDDQRVPGDRKSTRLNSSHQIISYAVFCLKKK